MKTTPTQIFTTPAECEKTFYTALAQKNSQQMCDVWAQDEDVVCVLPSGLLIQGYNMVCNFWQDFFKKMTTKYNISVNVRQQTNGVMLTAHNVIEELSFINPENNQEEILLTVAINLYIRTADGWRLLMRQTTASNKNLLSQNANIDNNINIQALIKPILH